MKSDDRVRDLYRLIQPLPRHSGHTPSASLPTSGIYLFFEHGETVQFDGNVYDRIVRVGTHNRDGNFRQRIRQHYGLVNSFGGNKNGSVFRKHVGGALLRREHSDDVRLPEWLRQMGVSDPEVEVQVSHLLRAHFTFCCVRVDDADERLSFERGLIALLAQHRVEEPSPSWLGRYAAASKIRESGLWNTQAVDALPLTDREYQRFTEIVATTLAVSTT